MTMTTQQVAQGVVSIYTRGEELGASETALREEARNFMTRWGYTEDQVREEVGRLLLEEERLFVQRLNAGEYDL